jgi:hypothetical protein
LRLGAGGVLGGDDLVVAVEVAEGTLLAADVP